VTGNPGTPSEVGSRPAGPAETAARPGLRDKARAFWAAPAGKAIVAATVFALVIRLFTLTRPGFLTSVNEYDDGVYLGAAIRLLQGALPYHNYAFVQPPGIILIAVPAAIVAKLTASSAAGMGVARVMTALASTACVPLAGNLVRYRGALVTLVTCGLLAVYPDDITAAHTLLLEPWMNLVVLIGVNAAFRRGHLRKPVNLLWAGVAIGAAGSIKYWAIAPAVVLLACCLLVKPDRVRRVRAYIGGLVAGFAVFVVPFAASTPVTFLRSTLQYQATRTGTVVPLSLRLAHLTGLIDLLNDHGGLDLHPGSTSMFASDSTAYTSSSSAGFLSFVIAAIIVAIIAVAYLWNPRRPSILDWFALATAALASIAMLYYSAFFYHYPAWAAPWAAITVGCAAGLLAGRHGLQRRMVYAAGTVVVLIGLFEGYELGGVSVGTTAPISDHIPAGACVVSDEVSLMISADRFTSDKPGCPDVIDSLATTLVLSGGTSIQGGASNMPKVVQGWKNILGKAGYVWVSTNSDKRIPWTQKPDPSALWIWFTDNFTPVTGYSPSMGQLFKRDS
jgi:alpha-1,2-mannosyltransferase